MENSALSVTGTETTQDADLLAEAMSALEQSEPDRIKVPSDIDEALRTAPAAWYIAYKQGVFEQIIED
jgi:hypothetical protein